jgi:DNA-binding transcriptional ArsR family regulator
VDITEIGSALSNPTRVRLLQLLSEGDYTASSAHKAYNENFSDDKHRESIYRELENLVEHGFLDKNYEMNDKELQYSLRLERFEVNLANSEIKELD